MPKNKLDATVPEICEMYSRSVHGEREVAKLLNISRLRLRGILRANGIGPKERIYVSAPKPPKEPPREPANLTGQTFGRLTVVREAEAARDPNGHRIRRWECLCECGNSVTRRQMQLQRLQRDGGVSSCGCYVQEHATLLGQSRRTHGEGEGGNFSPEYAAWMGAKQRCYNPNYRRYDIYGGRGITMCKRWLDSYFAFLADMGRKPSPKHSLDRWPDRNGNYEPGNCRCGRISDLFYLCCPPFNIAPIIWITHNGQSKLLHEWAVELGIPRQTLGRYIKRGITIGQAIQYRADIGMAGKGGFLAATAARRRK